MSAVESALKRERVVVTVSLIVLIGLAWVYVWRGAGMGMSALAMTKLALFPHLMSEPMPAMTMPAISWATVVVMWWVMMIAMMTPSAAPLVLLYGRVMRHARAQGHATATYVPSASLAAGYLSVWFGFACFAAALQALLQRAELISPMMLWSRSATLSAVVLAAAGVYQLTPLKYACLKHCRGPAHFITQHMRPGRLGAFRMGVDHGIWCAGCCWMLMALLFVGGIMNLVWIAVLTLLVIAEKIFPHGALIGRVVGVALIAWSAATLLV